MIECKSLDWLTYPLASLEDLYEQIEKHYKGIRDYKDYFAKKLGLADQEITYRLMTPKNFPTPNEIVNLPTGNRLKEVLDYMLDKGYRFWGFEDLRRNGHGI